MYVSFFDYLDNNYTDIDIDKLCRLYYNYMRNEKNNTVTESEYTPVLGSNFKMEIYNLSDIKSKPVIDPKCITQVEYNKNYITCDILVFKNYNLINIIDEIQRDIFNCNLFVYDNDNNLISEKIARRMIISDYTFYFDKGFEDTLIVRLTFRKENKTLGD